MRCCWRGSRSHLELACLRQRLEARVSAQTVELVKANEMLQADITERKRAEGCVERK